MALQKGIEMDNGVVLNYHRICSLNKITNICNMVEISSYISESQREKERQYQLLQQKSAQEVSLTEQEQETLNKGINVLVESDFIQIPYDETQTIEDVYEYLKTTEKYKDSVDC